MMQLEAVVQKLHDNLRRNNYAGHEPYDGLESRLFKLLPLRESRHARLAMIQAVKRCPVNIRRFIGVPRARNPKGLALCVMALLRQNRAQHRAENLREARELLGWLAEHQSKGFEGCSWGYNFDWQCKAFFVAKDAPNAVCTIFVARAFQQAYQELQDGSYLEIAERSCHFLRKYLLEERGDEANVKYVPDVATEVHNVNFLAAALLGEVAKHTNKADLLDTARRIALFSTRRQNVDGSWPYGEAPYQRWVDNFHTGYNLVALRQISRQVDEATFSKALRRGYEFWSRNLMTPEGIPKYYVNRTYPIDVHSVAQAILTYLEFANADETALQNAHKVSIWALQNLYSRSGSFYFQKRFWYTNRIEYIRWGQCWMFLALSTLLYFGAPEAHKLPACNATE
jgi:hypothetical protein